MSDSILTIQEAAEVLTISVSSLRRLIHDQEIPVIRIGQSVRLRRVDLDAFVDGHVTVRPNPNPPGRKRLGA